MRTAPLLLAMFAIAAGTSAVTSLLFRPPAAAPSDEQGIALAAIQQSLEELRRENQALRMEIADLRSAPVAAGAGLSREPVLDELVARAVERWMRENAGSTSGTAGAEAEEKNASADFSLEGALGQLMNPLLTGDEREALWQMAIDGGKLQELISALELRAAADPRNTALQFELGYAYLQPIMSGQAPGPQAAGWAIKADAAFDKTLALDGSHWDARFNKAISYTFWPPIMGKQQAAIANFETLVTQQAGMSPRPEFANTYLYLGNLYEQTGKADKAREIWSQGLGLFPGSGELSKRLNPN